MGFNGFMFASANFNTSSNIILSNNIKARTKLENHFGRRCPLHMTVGCQPRLGEGKAVSPLVWSRCTTPLGSCYQVLKTIVIFGFLRPPDRYFWTVTSLYHDVKVSHTFYSHLCRQTFNFGSPVTRAQNK